jgi:hypothetical protein
MAALTPLGKVAARRPQWFANVSLYTLGGLVSSSAVGGGLGYAGTLLLPPGGDAQRICVAVAVALLAAGRDAGLGWIPLPQLGRQTDGRWAKRRRAPVAAFLWGLELGAVFTTWFTFAGVWLLVALAFLSSSPAVGAGLFVAYWLGRALSVWIGPVFIDDARATPRLVASIDRQTQLARRVHVAALVWGAVLLVVMLVSSVPVT